MTARTSRIEHKLVEAPADGVVLEGDLSLPENPVGIVVFAHGSGSSRLSPRNRHVAAVLQNAGLATLLIDLLTKEEEVEDDLKGHLRFNIPFLADRLLAATDWVRQDAQRRKLKLGYFGASTGAAAALIAAARLGETVGAVVSRGGRPDLASPVLPQVKAPTLLIVGGRDLPVIPLNEGAFGKLRAVKDLKIVPGATHLFEEPGALDQVAQLAAGWFLKYLAPSSATSRDTQGEEDQTTSRR